MGSPLKILVIEDLPSDFLLLQRNLQQHGLQAECRRVSNDAELDDALRTEWDVVLADYNVPGMDFRTALFRLQKYRSDLPVILVSSSVGEENAVALLKLGMSDFILKENLTRLPTAILRALEENKERHARHMAEAALFESQAAALEEQHQGRVAALNLMEDAISARALAETANAALSESERRLLMAQEGAHVGVWEWDVFTNKTYWSPECERLYGVAPGGLRNNKEWRALVHPDDLPLIDAQWEKNIARGEEFEVEYRLRRPSGEIRWLVTKGLAHLDASGKALRLSGINLDITERKQNEEQLRKLSLAVEQSPESIAITDLDAKLEYVNEAFVRITGYSREEAIGQNPRILHSDNTPKSTYVALWKNLTAGKTWQGEFYNQRKDGSEYIEHAIISPLRQPDGRITHYVAIKEDITEKKRTEAMIHHLAFYDGLTGLPNRALLLERMEQTLALTRRDKHHSALVLFNIDRFKNINDAGGQLLGDALLKALGERVSGLLREGDVLARVSGDEFAILLPDFDPKQQNAAYQSMRVVEKILSSLLVPFNIGESNFTVSACLGIALFPESGKDTPLDILRRSNTALHSAKANGTGQSAFFEGELDEVSKQRFNIERELRQGIESGELRLFLQPQVDAAGKTVGAEALVRWQHPVRGLLPPATFITIAEESDLIVKIGEWVYAEVCNLLVQYDLHIPLRIAVNISPRHFRQPDFVAWIKRGLTTSGADPSRLTLEITEGMVINNINNVIAKMSELSALGIHFSMDDFGTGYSSLAYLIRLPINELKIDKSFIQDVTTDPEAAALVEAILAVAKLMHLTVVAEGVETVEQAVFLNQRAIVIHQGYLFGKPEPAGEMLANIINTRG